MSFAYQKPGVTIDELINPTFQPFLGDPTSIVIVGPARGYESKVEFVQLLDEIPAALSVDDGIDITGLTVQSQDGATTYIQGTATGGTGPSVNRPNGDYYVSGNEIIRSMASAISSDQTIVLYYELDPNGSGVQVYQEEITPHLTDPVQLSHGSTSGGDTAIEVFAAQSKGVIPDDQYTLSLGFDPAVLQIVAGGAYPALFTANSNEELWVDYTDLNGVRQVNQPLVLSSGQANFSDPQPDPDPDVARVVVRNTSDSTVTDAAVRYASTTGSNGLLSPDPGPDFTVLASGGATIVFTFFRADVSPSNIASGDTVKVTYNATPSDYYVPTQVFSQGDVEDKYGPALDVNGNIVSPVSLASSLAFANGATDMVIQALFHVSSDGFRSAGGADTSGTSDAINIQDWRDTFEALRDVTDVNVVVPLVSTGSGNYSDTLSLNVFLAAQAHIQFMIDNQDEYLVAICGEDSTVRGPGNLPLASPTTLQSHALTLGATQTPEVVTLISPGGFQYASSNGTSADIGGQYVAAMVAGRLASQDIQQTLTRRSLIGLTAIKDIRSERDKDSDAASGLFVIENKRGVIQVRHAITVAVNNSNTRELSVIRAKGYMVENVKNVIDNQVIGQIIVDDRAAFTVQTLVEAELDSLVTEGAIVSYQDVQARLVSSDPSTIEIRFSYLPAFPLNYVNIVFSINTASGVITTNTTQGL